MIAEKRGLNGFRGYIMRVNEMNYVRTQHVRHARPGGRERGRGIGKRR